MRIRQFASTMMAALLLAPVLALSPAAPAAAQAEQCFPETGQCLRGLFYQYWLTNGGLAQQGLPLTAEFEEFNEADGNTYRTQYTERARFEYHPENAGTPFVVLLGLLGREQLLAKYPGGNPGPAVPPDPGQECATFPQTGRTVCGPFLTYWRANGALAQQGLPLTEVFNEVNPTNGQTYQTQYFERARFEYHPENAGTPFVVLLGLLGREQYIDRVIFRDDTYNPASGWTPENTADFTVGPVDGEWSIRIKQTEFAFITYLDPTLNATNVRVEVDVRKAAGPDENAMGLVCRYQEQGGSFYFFIIGSDGAFNIGKYDSSGFTSLLPSSAPLTSPAVRRGGATNHLRADCVGSRLTFYVNGQRIAEAEDGDYRFGAAGVYADTGTTAGLDARFKNFVVYRP